MNNDQDEVPICSRCGGEILGGVPGRSWQCRIGKELAVITSTKRCCVNGVCADNTRGVFIDEFSPRAFPVSLAGD